MVLKLQVLEKGLDLEFTDQLGYGVDEAFYFCVPSGDCHVQEVVDVCFICVDWVFDRSWDGAQDCLMEDLIFAFTGLLAGFDISNIAFDEMEVTRVQAAVFSW